MKSLEVVQLAADVVNLGCYLAVIYYFRKGRR